MSGYQDLSGYALALELQRARREGDTEEIRALTAEMDRREGRKRTPSAPTSEAAK